MVGLRKVMKRDFYVLLKQDSGIGLRPPNSDYIIVRATTCYKVDSSTVIVDDAQLTFSRAYVVDVKNNLPKEYV